MADVFAKQGKLSVVRSLYSQVNKNSYPFIFVVCGISYGLSSFVFIIGGTYLALSFDRTPQDLHSKYPKS